MNSPDPGFASIASPENRPVPPVKVELAQLPLNPPRNRFMSVISVLFLFCLLGAVCSFIYISRAQKIYESNAKIKIELRDGPTLPGLDLQQFAETKHEKLIGQYNIVFHAINRGSVGSLEVFDYAPKDEFGQEIEDERVDFVMNSLNAVADPDYPSIIEVTYRCPVQMDAQTILHNVVAAYKEELDQQFKQKVVDLSNGLFRSRGVIEEELELAKNAEPKSPAYIQEIEKRLAKVNGELFDMKVAGFGESFQKTPVRFETLENATDGELVWPNPATVLMYGLGIGLIIGAIVCVLAAVFLKPQSLAAVYR
jgi:hypothetical protein